MTTLSVESIPETVQPVAAATRRARGVLDKYTLWLVLAMMAVGSAAVYSASSAWGGAKFGSSEYFITRHGLRLVIGFGLMILVSRVKYRLWRKVSKPMLFGTVVLLLLLLVTGGAGSMKGANRWISIFGLSFQPSELAKWVLLIHLSTLLAEKERYLHEFKRGFVPCLIWVGAVVGLIAIQPSFSMAATVGALAFLLMFIGGVDWKHIVGVGLAVVPVGVLFVLLEPYRLQRVLNMMGKGNAETTYQLDQALIALGSGGLTGLGPGNSLQKNFFLPEPFNDFIFPIIGEEYGFIGAAFVITLFVLFAWRGFKIAKRAPDTFGRLLAVAITMTVTLYALVNIAITCGLLPTTGLPMPFISYGGTSVFFTSIAIGILLNVSAYADLEDAPESATAP